MKRCPYCAEEIQDAAVKCRYCMEFLDPAARARAYPPPPLPPAAAKPSLPWYFRTPNIIIALLCVGPLALPMIWFRPKLSLYWKLGGTVAVLLATWWLGVLFAKGLVVIQDNFKAMQEVMQQGM